MPTVSEGDHPSPTADALRERIAAMQPPPAALATWDGALLSNALWRMKQVVDVWQDCRSLRIIITREEGSWRPRFRHWRLGGTERYFDRGMLLFSTGSAAAADLRRVQFVDQLRLERRRERGDARGGGVLLLRRARRTRAARVPFFVATAISVVAAGVYLFVDPADTCTTFPMLVIMFAVPFIFVGTLIPRPQFNLATMLVAVNTATFISIQGAYDANFLTFMNSNLAGPAGLLFAFCGRA